MRLEIVNDSNQTSNHTIDSAVSFGGNFDSLNGSTKGHYSLII